MSGCKWRGATRTTRRDIILKRGLHMVLAVFELLAVLWDGVREGWRAADFRGRLSAWREVIGGLA